MLTLSLIIPVFNEERHILACLEALKNQTIMPYEVLVVDNNCTDRTIEIANSFDFVTVIKETRQGRAYARNAGFNEAKGQIIGRIDADSRVSPDWVERVVNHFSTDKNLQGLSGIAWTDIIPYTHRIKTTMFARSYYWGVHMHFRTVTLWGATMALRKSAWNKVKTKTINDDRNVHEDQDVSIWLAAEGMKLAIMPDVRIITTGQTYRFLPKLFSYWRMQYRTKIIHQHNGNLSNPKTPRLALVPLLPGLIAGLPFGIYLIIMSVLTFPIDTWLLYRHGRVLR